VVVVRQATSGAPQRKSAMGLGLRRGGEERPGTLDEHFHGKGLRVSAAERRKGRI
jgi:hypothetical protein